MTFGDKATLTHLGYIFSISFLLNLVWEYGHAPLYAAYQDLPITNLALLKATAGDALFLTALSIPFFRIPQLSKHPWLILPVGIIAAVSLEMFALTTGRWEYNSLMPLVPYLHVGFTPTIQLGILGYIAYVCTKRLQEKKRC